MVLFTIVVWLHIFGAIGWLGAAMVFGMIVGPGLAKLSPQSRADFVLNVVPRYTRYTLIFAVVTLVFGIGSLVTLPSTNSSGSSPYGIYISIGALLALIAFGIGVGVTIPSANKMVKIIKSMAGNAGPPPPELKASSNRMRIGSTVSMVILVLVTILMVVGSTL